MTSNMSPIMSPDSYHSFQDDEPSYIDMSHLSGMTLSNFTTKEPHSKIHLMDASPSVTMSKSTRSSMIANSKRSSTISASTTKSQLRHTNQLLIGMLQNIQTELEAHRSIMLDIQHRVTHLEDESEASVRGNADTHLSALEALEGNKSSKPIPPEGIDWWEACQAFAQNSEPPISATEFLRTPKRLSGFNFDWPLGPPQPRAQAPPQQQQKNDTTLSTTPKVEDLPPLTPTSEEGDNSDLDTPTRHDIFIGEEILPTPEMPAIPVEEEEILPTPEMPDIPVEEEEIKGQEVEVNPKRMPAPPLLQPAPVGKPSSVKSEEKDLPALPEVTISLQTIASPQIIANPHRYYKGVKSLTTYKALLRHKPTEKEHQVLIHFHKRADLTHLNSEE